MIPLHLPVRYRNTSSRGALGTKEASELPGNSSARRKKLKCVDKLVRKSLRHLAFITVVSLHEIATITIRHYDVFISSTVAVEQALMY